MAAEGGERAELSEPLHREEVAGHGDEQQRVEQLDGEDTLDSRFIQNDIHVLWNLTRGQMIDLPSWTTLRCVRSFLLFCFIELKLGSDGDDTVDTRSRLRVRSSAVVLREAVHEDGGMVLQVIHRCPFADSRCWHSSQRRACW